MSTTIAGSSASPSRSELWRIANFRWLLASSSVAVVGSQFSLVAIPWLALKFTGQPTILAATTALMAIPQVALILVGGVIADRFSPRTILTVTNLCNASFLLLLALALLTGTLSIPMLLLLAFLLGVSGAFAHPTFATLLPKTVPIPLLATANSALMSVRQVATLCGPVLAGSLIAWFSRSTPQMSAVADSNGIALALTLDAVSFLIAVGLIRRIRIDGPAQAAVANKIFACIAEGFRWLWNDRALRTLLFYYASMLLLVAGPSQVGSTIIVDTQLGGGATGLGVLLTSTSLGSIAGMALAGWRSETRLATLGTTVLAVDAVGGVALILLGQTHSIVIAAALCLMVGLGAGYIQVGVITWIQQRLPFDMLGRAMSVIMLILMGAVPLSAAATGALLSRISVPLLFAVCGTLMSTIALLCLGNRTLRSIDNAVAPAGDVARS